MAFRRCLGCWRQFLSTGPDNRICPKCRKRNAQTAQNNQIREPARRVPDTDD